MRLPPNYSLPEQDLNHILEHLRTLFAPMRGERLFLTGGTGFVGMWLVESFLWMNEHLALDAEISVLSRDPERFYAASPHLKAHSRLKVISGDVRHPPVPDANYSYVILGAGTPDASSKTTDRAESLEVLTEGTARTLEFAERCHAKSVLLVSSGAVYQGGANSGAISEADFKNASLDLLSAYARGKIEAERLCVAWSNEHQIPCKIARCFSFLGPYLSLEAAYAASSFLANALKGEPIRIQGDGKPWRSYLYAADLAIWLWTILLKGESCRPYNVGSSAGSSLEDFAKKIAFRVKSHVVISRPSDNGRPPPKYVPNTDRAKQELLLGQYVTLDDMIERTLAWHKLAQTIVPKASL